MNIKIGDIFQGKNNEILRIENIFSKESSDDYKIRIRVLSNTKWGASELIYCSYNTFNEYEPKYIKNAKLFVLGKKIKLWLSTL